MKRFSVREALQQVMDSDPDSPELSDSDAEDLNQSSYGFDSDFESDDSADSQASASQTSTPTAKTADSSSDDSAPTQAHTPAPRGCG